MPAGVATGRRPPYSAWIGRRGGTSIRTIAHLLALLFLLAAARTSAAGPAVLDSGRESLALTPYLLGGAVMWFLMLKSGVHATITGVLLAFAIPYSAKEDDHESPSHRLEHLLHQPAAFVILPLFALANTAIAISPGWAQELTSSNSLGIIGGLAIGKPLGITLFSLIAVSVGICRLPLDIGWRHIVGAGLLGGIGFTMSIFIANLAFPGATDLIDASKIAILGSSLLAGCCGFLWLKFFGEPVAHDHDADTMDYEH